MDRVDFKMLLKSPDTIEFFIYDDVEKYGYNPDTDSYGVSETSSQFVRNKLAENPNCSKINIYINSRGGSVIEGIGIYNQLKRHAAYKTVYIDGLAGSIASVIAMCADKLVMPTNARLFIHNASCCCYGNAIDMRKCADDLEDASEQAKAIYLEKSGGKITHEQLTALMDAETSLDVENAIKYGFCDEIATFARKEPPTEPIEEPAEPETEETEEPEKPDEEENMKKTANHIADMLCKKFMR